MAVPTVPIWWKLEKETNPLLFRAPVNSVWADVVRDVHENGFSTNERPGLCRIHVLPRFRAHFCTILLTFLGRRRPFSRP